MSQAELPLATTAVSILEFGRWLDGVVVETNAATGEFLVDFDDEADPLEALSASGFALQDGLQIEDVTDTGFEPSER